MRTILVVGQKDRDEFQPLFRWFMDLVSCGNRCVTASGLSGIRELFEHYEFPDLIVVFQSWSEEYSHSEVHEMLAYAPLARVVVCVGAWCESDGRNHSIWPLSVRTPVWSAMSRIRREWQLIETPGKQVPLPWSASREEIFAADHPPLNLGKWGVTLKVLIDSPDPSYRQYLIERLTEGDHRIVLDHPTVVMFDIDPWGAARAAALNDLRLRHPQVEIVALANFIQPATITELSIYGVHKILPKLTTPWDEFAQW